MKTTFVFLFVATMTVFANAAVMSKVENGDLQNEPATLPQTQATEIQTYNLDQKKKTSFLSNFSGSLWQETFSNINGVATGKGNAESDYAVNLIYKLDDKTSLKAYSEWDHSWGLNNSVNPKNKSYTDLQDPYIGLTRTSVIETASGLRLDTQARAYAPIGVDSRVSNQAFEGRLYGILSQTLGKSWVITLQISPRFFVQNDSKYIEPHSGNTYGTPNFKMEDFIGAKYSINDKFAVEQVLGVYNMWFNADTTKTQVGTREDFLIASSSLIYTPTKKFYLRGGIRQGKYSTNLRDSGSPGMQNGFYSPDQSEYFFSAALSL